MDSSMRDRVSLTPLHIRFLYFEGCPNEKPALRLLQEVLAEKDLNVPIEYVVIQSEEDAEKYHFLGSPSIQVNNLDREESRRHDPPFFGCRLYKTAQGTSGIPPREMIIHAIEEALKTS